jgi:hypothetical protein
VTALCGGGTSAPRPGYSTAISIGAGLLATLLTKYGGAAAWLERTLGWIDLGDLVLGTFCATDPPAIPTFDATDAAALLGLNFGTEWDTAIGKVRDLMLHLAWYEFCYCQTGSQTALPAPAAPPTGVALPVNPSVSPCVQSVTYNARHFAADGETFIGPLVSAFSKNPTTVQIQTVTKIETGAGFPIDFKVYFEALTPTGAYNGVVSNATFSQTTPSTATHTFQVPSGVQAFELSMAHTGGSGIVDVDLVWNIYCNGAYPGQTGGNAPDPATQAMLRQILDLVTLIQRQAVPFAYVSGATHSGLSGTGTIDCQGLLGVLLNVSVPARAGEESGTPDVRFEVGRVNFGTADGYVDRQIIFTDSQVVFPSRAGLFTVVGYSLAPDVTMTLTELLREP